MSIFLETNKVQMDEVKTIFHSEKIQSALLSHVCLDVMLGKKFCAVHRCYDEFLHMFYLKAESLNKQMFIILPHLSCQDLDLKKINALQSQFEEYCFLVALCDNDSNILYYHHIQGLSDI